MQSWMSESNYSVSSFSFPATKPNRKQEIVASFFSCACPHQSLSARKAIASRRDGP